MFHFQDFFFLKTTAFFLSFFFSFFLSFMTSAHFTSFLLSLPPTASRLSFSLVFSYFLTNSFFSRCFLFFFLWINLLFFLKTYLPTHFLITLHTHAHAPPTEYIYIYIYIYIYGKSVAFYTKRNFNFCTKINSSSCNLGTSIFAYIDQSAFSFGTTLFSIFIYSFIVVAHGFIQIGSLILKDKTLT